MLVSFVVVCFIICLGGGFAFVRAGCCGSGSWFLLLGLLLLVVWSAFIDFVYLH